MPTVPRKQLSVLKGDRGDKKESDFSSYHASQRQGREDSVACKPLVSAGLGLLPCIVRGRQWVLEGLLVTEFACWQAIPFLRT